VLNKLRLKSAFPRLGSILGKSQAFDSPVQASENQMAAIHKKNLTVMVVAH
jgi:hypothetical protein